MLVTLIVVEILLPNGIRLVGHHLLAPEMLLLGDAALQHIPYQLLEPGFVLLHRPLMLCRAATMGGISLHMGRLLRCCNSLHI